ncbi:MAG: ABC transporter ATP-binding protein [Thermodesulfobacteriota bacterium]
MNPLIQVANLSKTFNRHRPDEMRALAGVSLQINQGEGLVLKGTSGSGKTTLLSLLGCMARPTSGSIHLEGRNIAKLPERFLTTIRRRTFGFIFQQFNLIRHLSVLDNVSLPLYPTSMRESEMRARARQTLERLNIGSKERTMVNKLSGGEQQRVAIARALINQPEIIIADEPTAHLDSHLSGELLDILAGLKEQGKTLVIATHDPEVYGHGLVDRIVAMRDGRIAEAG